MKVNMRRKTVSVLFALLLCAGLFGCNGTKKIDGHYDITKLVYQGMSLTLSNGFEDSEIDINRSKDNIFGYLTIALGDEISYLNGHLQEIGTKNEYTQYKFWIDNSMNYANTKQDYIYLYYNPKEDNIFIDGGDVEFYFGKKK